MSKHPLPQAPLKATPAIMPLHTRHLPLQTAPASQDSFRRPKNHRSDMYPRSQLTYSISFEPKPGYNVQQHTPPDPDAHPSTSTSHHRPPPPNLDAYTRTSPPDPRLHTPRRPIEIYVLTPPPRGPQRSQSYNDTPTRYNNTSSNNNHTSSRDSSPSRRTRFIFDIPHHTPPSPPSRRTPPLNTHPNECPITPTSMHRKSTTTSTQTRTSPSHRPPTPPSLILPLNSNPLVILPRSTTSIAHRIYTPISVPKLSASSPKRSRGFFNQRRPYQRGVHRIRPAGFVVPAGAGWVS